MITIAITKLLHMKEGTSSKGISTHLNHAIAYIKNPVKTESMIYVQGYNCSTETAYEEFMKTKIVYGKPGGRQGYHFIISFKKGETDPETANKIADRFVNEYLAKNYETIMAIHTDKKHLHAHIIFNSVSFRTGLKFHYKNGDWRKDIQPITNMLCKEYGLSQIELEDLAHESVNLPYEEWERIKETPRDTLRRKIDEAISEVYTFRAFLEAMESKCYKVRTGKWLSFKPPDKDFYFKAARCGEMYSESSIRQRIKENELDFRSSIHRVNYASRYRGIIKTQHGRYNMTWFQAIHMKVFVDAIGIRDTNQYQGYKYQADAVAVRKYNEQVRFLYSKNIRTMEGLKDYEQSLQNSKKSIDKERIRIYGMRKRFKEDFKLLDELLQLQKAENFYQAGEEGFESVHERYEIIKELLRENNLSIPQLIEKKESFDKAIAENRKRYLIYKDERKVVARIEAMSKKRYEERKSMEQKKCTKKEKRETKDQQI